MEWRIFVLSRDRDLGSTMGQDLSPLLRLAGALAYYRGMDENYPEALLSEISWGL